MSRLPVRQSVAERWTRVAFACALAAGVGTAAIFMLPAPKAPDSAGRSGSEVAVPERKPPRAPSEGVSTNWPAIAGSVGGLKSPLIALWIEEEAARKAAAAANQPPDGGGPTMVVSSGFAPPWRYLGSISDGVQHLALVVIDGRQRFVREGFRSHEGYQLMTIEPERLVIEQGSARHEVPLEASTRPGGLSGAAATPRPAPARFDRAPFDPAEGGVRTASGDASERRLREGEPLSVERARQGLRGTPVRPGGGGGR